MIRLLFACLLALIASAAQAQTCTSTLSAGANIASAISSASGGAVICLNSGTYGAVTVSSVTKSPAVTVMSTSGTGATIGFVTLAAVNGITFDHLNIPQGFQIDGSGGASKNLTISNSLITGGGQITLNVTGNTNANIVIDGNTLGGYNSSGFEGTITVWRNPQTGTNAGVTIKNNTFAGGSCADGIQLTGSSSGVTIGPGNRFENWVQGSCGPHVDAIQFVGGSNYTITGNYFNNNTINSGIYDGASNVAITNNVYNTGNGTGQHHQIGGVQTMNMSHNTFRNNTIAVGTKSGDSPNSGWVVQNNIFVNSDFIAAGDQPGCGSGCIMRFNLIDSQSSTTPTSTSSISGSPTWLGGTNPATWAGFELASGSLGENAGNDGLDMGTTYYGTAVATDTTPPVISGLLPTGTQATTTTSVTLQATTDEAATCRYNTTNVAYTSMVNTFSNTGGTTHTNPGFPVTSGTSYTRYVRCIDTSGNANTSSSTISFSVANPSVSSVSCTQVSPTQSPGSIPCSASVSGTVSSYAWSLQTPISWCSFSTQTASTSLTCQYGANPKPCVTILPGSNSLCTTATYPFRYNKPSGFGTN